MNLPLWGITGFQFLKMCTIYYSDFYVAHANVYFPY